MEFLSDTKTLRHLIGNEAVRSYTVIPVTAERELITRIKSEAKGKGLLLGEGYGQWKEDTFRIANFPALKKDEIAALKRFLRKF